MRHPVLPRDPPLTDAETTSVGVRRFCRSQAVGTIEIPNDFYWEATHLRIALSIRARAAATLCGMTAALAIAGCGGKQTIKDPLIGEFDSMTGPQSTFGTSTHNGEMIAIDDVNASGGIDGHKVGLKLYDDQCDPAIAATVVRKLISQDHVSAVLGEVASTRSIAAAPECDKGKVPMISPSSTNPKVTNGHPYVFRVCFIDPFQGAAAAKFAIETLHFKTAAIFTDQANDYSTGLSGVFKDTFTKMGGKIVAESSYRSGTDVNFQAQLNTIKTANPQIIYVPGYYNDIGPIAKQARQIGMATPLLGGDGWDSDKLVEGAGGPGGAVEGCYFTNHYSVDNPDPLTQKFVKAYQAKYGSKPDSLAALGYDAAGVMLDAMKKAGAPADGDYASPAYRDKLKDAIAATQGFKGATGIINLGPDHNAVKPCVVLQIHGKDFKYVGTVQP